ncbi:unnamed protein product [Hymenolepis diminuta]|uniref:Mos1 transposase HTH domain-containing protein n=1 Tax=Hymenolepis diminuta TaxID=6216 RepID=A0A564Z9J2_HYMDI|nr:unnamed protein product [Hymenolepis diminuta]VUZ56096.1 unnamed protein product [Hymenolepis diminuta]
MYTPNKEHTRHNLLFESHQGNTAGSAAKTLKDTYANNVVNEKTCRRWFSAGGFKKDDFSLRDEGRTESRVLKNPILSNCKLPPMKVQPALLEQVVVQEMKRLDWEGLKGWQMDLTWEMEFVRNQQATAPFFDRIITNSDEKWWILYNNVKRRRQGPGQDSDSKPIPQPRQSGTAPEKMLLCVWWDLKGIVYYESMGDDQAITSEVYYQQLIRLKAVNGRQENGLL